MNDKSTFFRSRSRAIIPWMLGSRALQEPTVWLLTSLAAAFLMSCLTSIGPQLQTYLFSFISDGASIYASANGEDFRTFLTYRAWVSQIWTWPMPMFGLVIAIASLRKNRLSSIVLGCVLSAFLVQSLYDFTVVAWSTKYSLQFVAENLFGNLVGAAAIAFVLITCIYSYEWILLQLEASQAVKFSVALFVFPAIGILCLSVSYYFTRMLYEPTKVRLDLSFELPVSGHVISPDKVKKSADSEEDPSAFNWSSSRGVAKVLKWDSLFQSMEVKWSTPSLLEKSESFTIKAYLIGDCNLKTDVSSMELPQPLQFNGVKNFTIRFDDGPTDFNALPLDEDSVNFNVKPHSNNSFELIQYEDKKKNEQRVRLARYLDVGDELSLPFQLGISRFSLTAPLITRNNNQLVVGHRRIYIETDKESVTRAIGSSVTLASRDDLNCRGFDWGGTDAVGSVAVGQSKYVSVFITIESSLIKNRYPLGKGSFVTVAGGSGWLYASDIHPGNATEFKKGGVEQFTMQGNLKNIGVDGVLVPSKANESISAIGNFEISVERGPALSVSGSAESLWRDKVRINPTRWERLTIEGKLFLLGLLGAVFAVIFRLVVRRSRLGSQIQISPNSSAN